MLQSNFLNKDFPISKKTRSIGEIFNPLRYLIIKDQFQN